MKPKKNAHLLKDKSIRNQMIEIYKIFESNDKIALQLLKEIYHVHHNCTNKTNTQTYSPEPSGANILMATSKMVLLLKF